MENILNPQVRSPIALRLANLRRWLNKRVALDSGDTLSDKDLFLLVQMLRSQKIDLVLREYTVLQKCNYDVIVREHVNITTENLERSYVLETHLTLDEAFKYVRDLGLGLLTSTGYKLT